MIDLYLWPTPNGYKPLIFLEESGLEYTPHPINIMEGEQFDPDFLKIAPNNRIPAIVDDETSVFESGAILLYLAEKTEKFIPKDDKERYQVYEWLMWQMGGLGPMMGQAGHFHNFAPEDVPYGKKRYLEETHRLFGVLNKQLDGKDFITGSYSIADMACYPWVKAGTAAYLGISTEDYPNIQIWLDKISERDAVKRAYDIGAEISEKYKKP